MDTLKRESQAFSCVHLAGARGLCYLRNVSFLALRTRASGGFRRLFVYALCFALGAGTLGGLGALNEARAHGGGTAKIPETRPPAPPGDGAQAEKLLKQVEAAALEPRHAKVVQEALQKSAHALERAAGARAAGDAVHARMLDGLALEWAEAARDLLRAAKAEDEALASAKKARELSVQVERARALLAETEARRGRAAADLQKAEELAREAQQKASEAERQRLDKSKAGDMKKSGAASKDEKEGKAKPGAQKKSGAPAAKPKSANAPALGGAKK